MTGDEMLTGGVIAEATALSELQPDRLDVYVETPPGREHDNGQDKSRNKNRRIIVPFIPVPVIPAPALVPVLPPATIVFPKSFIWKPHPPAYFNAQTP
ncbi:MAG: hypothetical protein PHG48_05665 [Eubacteriales bacterium]|nr:hypothetical protein [Eubacteriales bacterium]